MLPTNNQLSYILKNNWPLAYSSTVINVQKITMGMTFRMHIFTIMH
jgi:hypothetical protein